MPLIAPFMTLDPALKEHLGGDPIRWQGVALCVILYGLLHMGLDALGYLNVGRGLASLWYPPAGLTFVAVALFGAWYLPVYLVVGLLAYHLLADGTLPWALVILLIAVTWATDLAALRVLGPRLGFDTRLQSFNQLIVLFVCAAAAAAVKILVVLPAFAASGFIAWGQIAGAMVDFLLGDLLGVALVAPFFFLWGTAATARLLAFRKPQKSDFPTVRLDRWMGYGALMILPALLYAVSEGALFAYAGALCFLILLFVALRHSPEDLVIGLVIVFLAISVLALGEAMTDRLQMQLLAVTLILYALIVGWIVRDHEAITRARLESLQTQQAMMAALDEAGHGLVLTDAEGTVQSANAPAQAVLQALGSAPRENMPTHAPGPAPGAQPVLQAALPAWNDEFPLPPSPEEPHPGVLRHVPAKAHGEIEAHLLIDVSTTAEERRKRERLEAKLTETQKLAAMGSLASSLAHEINNLLQPVLTYTNALEKAEDAKAAVYRDRIRQCVMASKKLIADVLASARGEAETQNPVRYVQALPLLTEVFDVASQTLPKTISLSRQFEGVDSVICASKEGLMQVALNLLTNASDAMDGIGALEIGSEPVVLDAQSAELLDVTPGNYLRLWISDTGEGLPVGQEAKIFEPFFTTKGIGAGTGLGLSVVYGLVRSWKAAIRASNQAEGGALVELFLPECRPTQTRAA